MLSYLLEDVCIFLVNRFEIVIISIEYAQIMRAVVLAYIVDIAEIGT